MGISYTPHAPIKVVRVIARLNIGGPAIQAILLTRYLPTGSFSPFLVTGPVSETEGDLLPYARECQINPFLISELGREISWRKDLISLWHLIKYLRRVRPHIVHTHTAKAGLLGRFAAWILGVPIRVHTFHGHTFHGYFSSCKTRMFLMLERMLAKVTHAIIAVSESQRRDLVETYRIASKSDIHVIPLGFDLEAFIKVPLRTGKKATLELGETFIVGFVGRLVHIKNPFLLLQAISRFKERHGTQESGRTAESGFSALHVDIIGEGELSEDLRHEVVRAGLDKTIHFLGWQRDMASIYERLHIVVLTSDNEGTPVALIEAMASGRPFIATNVGGIRDLMVGNGKQVAHEGDGEFTIFENGILVKARDAQGISNALAYAMDHEEHCSQMGKVGREFAVQHFSKDRLVSDIAFLYQRLLDSKC